MAPVHDPLVDPSHRLGPPANNEELAEVDTRAAAINSAREGAPHELWNECRLNYGHAYQISIDSRSHQRPPLSPKIPA